MNPALCAMLAASGLVLGPVVVGLFDRIRRELFAAEAPAEPEEEPGVPGVPTGVLALGISACGAFFAALPLASLRVSAQAAPSEAAVLGAALGAGLPLAALSLRFREALAISMLYPWLLAILGAALGAAIGQSMGG